MSLLPSKAIVAGGFSLEFCLLEATLLLVAYAGGFWLRAVLAHFSLVVFIVAAGVVSSLLLVLAAAAAL